MSHQLTKTGTGNESNARSVGAKSSRRRRIRHFLFVIFILLALEGFAWIGDAIFQYRRQLLFTLHLMKTVNQPITAQHDSALQLPRTWLNVRPPQTFSSSKPPYVTGGSVNQDAFSFKPVLLPIDPRKVINASEKRLFVVGGSAAYGYPYKYEDTFAGLLDKRLSGRGYRVINASVVGACSGELVPVVHRVVDHYSPHILIILAGNNEWFHWNPDDQHRISKLSSETLRVVSHSRAAASFAFWMLRFSYRHQQSKQRSETFAIHQELTGLSYALRHPMSHSKFDKKKWLATKRSYLDTFEDNMLQMIRYAQTANVRVILMTVPFNYRLSPAWKHPQPEFFQPEHENRIRELLKQSLRLFDKNDRCVCSTKLRDALELVDQALVVDPLPAVLHYQKGRCLEALGRFVEAEDAYALCREHMIGNLGSSLSVNQRIETLASTTDADLLDVRKLFDEYEHSRQHYFNEDLIHDDCHPTLLGHRIIAESVLRTLGF